MNLFHQNGTSTPCERIKIPFVTRPGSKNHHFLNKTSSREGPDSVTNEPAKFPIVLSNGRIKSEKKKNNPSISF